jgi:hypothetical protein
MAHGIKRSGQISLHQTLHGYDDGHRQLAASITLKPRDIKTMLVLSDISGSGARIDETGYLTGYPLSESGVFALGRTWSAPEMPRPGCVWTHTILIDFADLATFRSLRSLAALFQRPQSPMLGAYGKALMLDPDSDSGPLNEVERRWSRQILAGLYGKPLSRLITVRPDGIDVDGIVLALWSQQWPRLRRAFRFCTSASTDRSFDTATFDLQLLPSMDRAVRTRFPDALDAESVSFSNASWLDDAVADLMHPDGTGLRSFLRQMGSDVASGREAFRSLCQLYQLVESFKAHPEVVTQAINLLENELGSVQARAARGIVASAALEQAEGLEDEALEFILRNLDLVGEGALASSAHKIGTAIWRRDPGRLASMLHADGPLRAVSERTLQVLTLDELLTGIRSAPDLIEDLLGQRPELVTQSAFWAGNLARPEDSFSVLSRHDALRQAALDAIITSGRNDLAARTVSEFGAATVLEAIGVAYAREGENAAANQSWIAASTRDALAVAQYLASDTSKPRSLLALVARNLSPDAVPNEIGVDPWILAVKNAVGPVAETSNAYLNAYLLSRALGTRSRSAGELAQLGFEATHSMAADDRLPDDAWQLLEPRLPWSLLWFGWDRCERIRSGVADLFIERNLAPQIFAHVAAGDSLFLSLVKTAARSERGRSYLKDVQRVMKDEADQAFSSRIRGIDALLR